MQSGSSGSRIKEREREGLWVGGVGGSAGAGEVLVGFLDRATGPCLFLFEFAVELRFFFSQLLGFELSVVGLRRHAL